MDDRGEHLPLAGVLVVSLEQAVAAPFCTARLADAGAEVIKVERPEGDFARGYDRDVGGESAYFVWLNRGKKSIALDIKRPDDLALLHRMIAAADVFVQNLAPGAVERAGIGSAALRARHPALVTCDISGYGQDGPDRARKAYDLLIQCETGLASLTGTPDAPGRVGISICDIACGLQAHAGIVEALLARARTGRGGSVAVSLFEVMADWMSVPLLQYEHAGRAGRRVGLAHATIAPYGAYACCDGEIVVAVQNEREWRRFAVAVLERPALADDPRFADNAGRVAHRAALDAAIAGALAAMPRAMLAARLEEQDIASGAVNDLADLARHPQLRRASIETAAGPVRVPMPAGRGAAAGASFGSVPALDAHGTALRHRFAGQSK